MRSDQVRSERKENTTERRIQRFDEEEEEDDEERKGREGKSFVLSFSDAERTTATRKKKGG